MTREAKLNLEKARYNRLSGTEKNIKSSGVLRKIRRNIRNLEK